jgi:N-acyl homoserine lactone hydrolase
MRVLMSESIASEAVMPVINAHLAADLIVEGEQMPVFIWTIDHSAGRVLVDTGLIDSRPEIDDMSPTPHPENIPRDVACVINTHLHWDHCGGNRLFPGVPIHVQARELADARSLDNYTIREWVDFDGATYVEHKGEAEVLPGIRLLPAPGHTDGHQVVVVETDVDLPPGTADLQKDIFGTMAVAGAIDGGCARGRRERRGRESPHHRRRPMNMAP